MANANAVADANAYPNHIADANAIVNANAIAKFNAKSLAAYRRPQRRFEDNRAAELWTLNQKLQENLLAVGTAHRMATTSNITRERDKIR